MKPERTVAIIDFDDIVLKDMSWSILRFLIDKEPMRAMQIAEELGLSTRQVDAAITKSLVRHGFVVRQAQLTRVMKKEFNLIHITPRGERYVQWKVDKES